MMTIGDHPALLGIGYLLNQMMLRQDDDVTGADFDEELDVVVVRTTRRTNYEDKMKKRTLTRAARKARPSAISWKRSRTSSCRGRASHLLALPLDPLINLTPSLYLEAGAIHGCVLCEADRRSFI